MKNDTDLAYEYWWTKKSGNPPYRELKQNYRSDGSKAETTYRDIWVDKEKGKCEFNSATGNTSCFQ